MYDEKKSVYNSLIDLFNNDNLISEATQSKREQLMNIDKIRIISILSDIINY